MAMFIKEKPRARSAPIDKNKVLKIPTVSKNVLGDIILFPITFKPYLHIESRQFLQQDRLY